ncbi:kinase-like domain-containing protein [Paraphoma chrysanthemicola]|uniref:non-specific serine/threonine protein kinase n=1 Tax=Paraphoma chrysanthemicola TaxID=798071 RepID=A0A8K0R8G7_9PLEO|nr:kinase-like domain-containing protein [Paraphoma chrysanthemicola]
MTTSFGRLSRTAGGDLEDVKSSVPTIGPTQSWTTKDLEDYSAFSNAFIRQERLGKGSEGVVYAYRHLTSGDVIAVKRPAKQIAATSFRTEMLNMKILGQHDHIVEFLGYSPSHGPLGSAIFLRLAEFGSLESYRKEWCKQEHSSGRLECIPESTMWKLVYDMALALKFLHNDFDVTIVHNDFKPGNLLVRAPEGYDSQAGLPIKPVFILADFSRLAAYPTREGEKPVKWNGTPEYAPPRAEQQGPVTPYTDMWGLGATIQFFAFGFVPQMPRPMFIARRAQRGLNHPAIDDKTTWATIAWRSAIPVVRRPLDASQDYYDDDPDIKDFQPYSPSINHVCEELMRVKPEQRITAHDLVECVEEMFHQKLAMTGHAE